ncbi:hypothetical protein [Reichenbachiella sp.]|uniref:hypothetical protein n=1 Tax=Reichenbachiella sp. TaxID=2184521 RepID=UPI003B595438
MKYFLSLIVLLSSLSTMAQNDDQEKESLDLEMLQAPSSPAANLLGISDSDIQKPSDRNELVGLIRQSSDDFSSLPTSFAFDYSPFRKELNDFMNYNSKTNEHYNNVNLKSNLKQSLVFSVATQSLDSAKNDVAVSSQQFGLGIKLSLARGDLDKDFRSKILNIRKLKEEKIPVLDSIAAARVEFDSEIQRLKKEMSLEISERNFKSADSLKKRIAVLSNVINEEVEKEFNSTFAQIKSLTEGLSYDRFGFKWDIAAGMVLDFPNSSFDDGTLTKAGIWTVFGHEGQISGASVLGLVRYMYNPNKIYADENNANILESDVSTVDVGARFIIGNKNKLSGSLEAIYRSASVSEIENSWRFTLNTSYEVSKNQKLTFIFGRDFDGTITKNGNVIAALSYVRGFGSKVQL